MCDFFAGRIANNLREPAEFVLGVGIPLERTGLHRFGGDGAKISSVKDLRQPNFHLRTSPDHSVSTPRICNKRPLTEFAK
jgi:hypothetical protein